VWQTLYAALKDRNFTVLAVAMDSQPEAARPWVEAAAPDYPVLIDRNHVVAELYNMVNVPQAVWIDESGRIVRPTENAGAFEGFRAMDRATRRMPEEIAAKVAKAKATYVAAVRDWVEQGAASRHAFDPVRARAHVARMDDRVAEAHASFRFGLHLLRSGREAEARGFLDEARRLHPESSSGASSPTRTRPGSPRAPNSGRGSTRSASAITTRRSTWRACRPRVRRRSPPEPCTRRAYGGRWPCETCARSESRCVLA